MITLTDEHLIKLVQLAWHMRDLNRLPYQDIEIEKLSTEFKELGVNYVSKVK